MGIESVFRSMAGADWQGANGGGLSAEEFAAFLKDKAGADGAFDKGEFSKTAEKLGLGGGGDANSILDAFGKDGQISVDKFRDLLEKSAGSDKAFNLDELKGGLEKLADKAEAKLEDEKNPVADFAKDAGADKAISKDEFVAIAERAGVGGETAGKAFENIAGDDGEMSKDEFKEAFGGSKVGEDKLGKAIEKAAQGDEARKASEDKPFADFGKDAGADGAIDENEFKALAEEAGIDDETAQAAFDRIAGADGKISRDEFKAEDGLGAGKLSEEDFRSRVEELAGEDEASGCSAPDEAEETDDGASAASGTDEEAGCGSSGDEDDSLSAPSAADQEWSVQNADGQSTIKLGDKYTITAAEADSSWIVKNEETGQETKIHGDPHVDLNNDGSNDFDFKENMTWQLDDGTKITVDTVDAGNGTTLSSGLTITNGDNAVSVSGLAAGDQDGKLTVSQSMNGGDLDDEVDDGGLTIEEAGSGWTELDTGDVVDQELINRAEAAA